MTTTSQPETLERTTFFIGGEWTAPAGADTIEVIDPTTEQVIGSVPEGTPEDVDRAVAAAREAFEVWSQVPVQDRAEACAAIGAGLYKRQEEIASLISREVSADSIELATVGYQFDAIVAIGGCDKTQPACAMAMASGRL